MKVRQVLTSGIFTLLLAGAAHAQTTSFVSGTTWSTGNWSAGIPGVNSNALIGLPVTYDATSNPGLSSLTINATVAPIFLQEANALTSSVVTVGDNLAGRYEQEGGSLTAVSLIIGNTGTGAYVQSGGSLTVTGATSSSHLIIGAGAGGIGRFELSGTGTVAANAMHVGGGTTNPAASSSGTFVQTGGTVNVTGTQGDLIIGGTAGTSGRYELKGGSLTAGDIFVGFAGANPTVGDRSFAQSGGSVTVTDNLILGGFAGQTSAPAGNYTLSDVDGTSTLTTSKVLVGYSGSGTFTQTGGTHNLTQGDGSLFIAAAQAGSEGVYNMQGGVLNTKAIYVGSLDPATGATGGKATVNQTGGTVNVSEQLIVDDGGTPGSLGKYVMSGGSLNTTGVGTNPGLLVIGQFQHTGGTVTTEGVGADAGLNNYGTYTIAGGSLLGAGVKINSGLFTGYGTIGGTGKLINQGTMKFPGGTSTISAPVENAADSTLEVSGAGTTFSANVSNFGEFDTTGATVAFNALFQNSGEYNSASSTQTFSGGYESLAGGYLAASGTENVFKLGGALTLQNANSNLWNTQTAVLHFFKGTGSPDGVHSLLYAGLDLGDEAVGYQDNFAWAEVIIEAGNALATSDIDGRALYTEKVTFGSSDLTQITAQVATFSGDLTIYYDPADNPELQGRTFTFGSGTGSVSPVPEPSTMMLAGVGALVLSFRRRRA